MNLFKQISFIGCFHRNTIQLIHVAGKNLTTISKSSINNNNTIDLEYDEPSVLKYKSDHRKLQSPKKFAYKHNRTNEDEVMRTLTPPDPPSSAITNKNNLFRVSNEELLNPNWYKNPEEHDNKLEIFQNPSFHLYPYIRQSQTLQKLIQLGVNLHRIEKRKGLGQFLLNLDFDRDIQSHLLFLNDIGVESNLLGEIITKNPLIFKENLDDLRVRINYLEMKKFKPNEICRIIEKNPYWLMFNTKRIDKRLGYFQQQFQLSGNELRGVAVKQPKLITYNLEAIREKSFSIKEECGFNDDEIKALLIAAPKLWMMEKESFMERFDYAHSVMNLTHERLLQSPEIFYCRKRRLEQRHSYLLHLKRAQYNPTNNLYVSFKQLSEGDDEEFAVNVARTTYQEFEHYLRSL